MGEVRFKKKGFKGLTAKSKFIDVAVFAVVFLIALLIFKGTNDFVGLIKALAAALIVALILQLFLERDTYYYTEYFCADCGQYLGYSPQACDRCGSNRYSTEDNGVGRTIRSR